MTRSRTRTIRLQVFARASPKKMFEWITDPKLLSRWLVDSATIVPKKGGTYQLGWNEGPMHSGTVLDIVEGKHITLTWQWPGIEDQLVTRLKISVQRESNGTVVKFEHSGFPTEEKWTELYAGAIQGWEYFLMNLKIAVATGTDLRSPHDW
jgi:uncharacterized protein YndB with AHSA1/START domain